MRRLRAKFGLRSVLIAIGLVAIGAATMGRRAQLMRNLNHLVALGASVSAVQEKQLWPGVDAIDLRTTEAVLFFRNNYHLVNSRSLTVVGNQLSCEEICTICEHCHVAKLVLDSTAVSASEVREIVGQEVEVISIDRMVNEKIDAVEPYPELGEFQPAVLIGAVEHLASLGKTRSIDILRRRASSDSPFEHARIRLIVSMLFEPATDGELLPVPRVVEDFSELFEEPRVPRKSYLLRARNWWSVPIHVENGIPFLTKPSPRLKVLNASKFRSDYLLDWALDRARVRQSILGPRGDPVVAAKAVVDQLNLSPKVRADIERQAESLSGKR